MSYADSACTFQPATFPWLMTRVGQRSSRHNSQAWLVSFLSHPPASLCFNRLGATWSPSQQALSGWLLSWADCCYRTESLRSLDKPAKLLGFRLLAQIFHPNFCAISSLLFSNQALSVLPSSSECLQNATTKNRHILTGWPVRPFFLELQARMGRWSSFQVITGESFYQMLIWPLKIYFLAACPSTAKLWLHLLGFIMTAPHFELSVSNERCC